MRVVTLLPAATEIVAALGAGEQLVGISHECDWPASVRSLPRVTSTPIDPAAAGSRIDAQVRELFAAGQPVIAVLEADLAALRPDLIITQSQCQVCAVADGVAYRLADRLSPTPRVLSLGAHDLEGIWTDIRAIGSALGAVEPAERVVHTARRRLAGLAGGADRLVQTTNAPRVLCIEWLDPLYLAGHWVPELVALAGGQDVGAKPGSRSLRCGWDEAAGLRPDLILVMLCGMDVSRSAQELTRLRDPVALRFLASTPTWILDGNAHTSRAGPRVVDGAERIRAAIEGRGREMDSLQRWMP